VADKKSRVQLEEEWWDAWWAADYSWAGLAQKQVGRNGGTVHGGVHGEKTLQDYWRRDPATGAVRDDAAMAAAGELVEYDGTVFHIVHLPPKLKGGTPTWKADLKHADWDRLEALLAARLDAAQETKVDGVGDAEGPDGRAQWRGAIQRGATAHPQGIKSPLHLEASGACWLGAADFRRFLLGPGARFDSATFSGLASFDSATFSGEASFHSATFSGLASFDSATFSGLASFYSATFSGEASFHSATFSGEASFHSATFSGPARFDSATFSGLASFHSATFSGLASFIDVAFEGPASFRVKVFEKQARFDRCRFAQIVWFDGVVFRGDMDFTAAIFERLASFERIGWPEDPRHWHGAFDQALFRGTLGLTGAGFRSFAAFDGATLERGVQIDDATEAVARVTFRKERKAAIDASRADGDAWAEAENKRRKEADKENAKYVRRHEIAAHVRETRETRLKELERGCRVLKQAMEKASNKSREQLLYRFELQARRAQRGLPPGEALFSDLYALASDYGASMVRPFLALAVVIGVFAAVFYGWAGLLGGVGERDGEVAPAAAVWQALDLSWANTFKPLSALTSDGLGEGTVSATLLKTAPAPVQFAVRALATLQSLLAIVLAFLFALAVRRRFQIT
jgi:hypothetical protein